MSARERSARSRASTPATASSAARASPGEPAGAPSAIVLMGVSGCGKTTVGRALATRLGWSFHDGDDYHPPANVEKMRAGQPLNDEDRGPWLDRLNALLRHSLAKHQPVVLACSALRQRYRDRLADRIDGVLFVHLAGSREQIAQRLAARAHRYMPASLLASQFEALEPPADALTVDVSGSVEEIVEAVASRLAPGPGVRRGAAR